MSTTTAPRTSTTLRRRLAGRSIRRLLASLLSLAALGVFVGAGSASAVVANNGLNVNYGNQNGCTVSIGDQASPRGWAIGELDVGSCSAAHSFDVVVYLQLSSSSTMSGQRTVTSGRYSRYGYYDFVQTGAICNTAGYYQTQGYVNWDGRGWVGPYYSKVGYYRAGAC